MTGLAPLLVDTGGLAQCLAFSGDGYLYIGSDTQATYRTIRDVTAGRYGQNTLVRGRGMGPSSGYHEIAAIFTPQFDPDGTAGQVVYVATSGGVLKSVDRMDTWSPLATALNFEGNTFHVPGGVQDNWKRSGRRYWVEDSGWLFVATSNQGVRRSNNHGADGFSDICKMNGAAPGSNYYCRALCQDPDSLTTIYAGFGDRGTQFANAGGLWKSTNAHVARPTVPNFLQCSGLPTGSTVEDVIVLDSWVYVVLGTGGLWVASTANTNSWTQLGATGALDPTSWWSSIDVRNDGSGNHLILAGCSKPVKKAGDDNWRCVVRLTRRLSDGVITSTLQMTNLNSQLDVGRIQIPGGTRSWWNSGVGMAMKSGFVNPHVRWDPDPSHVNDIYMAASQGLYRWNSTVGQWQLCSNVMPQYLAHDLQGCTTFCLWTTSDWGLKISLSPGSEDASSLNAISPLPSAQSHACAISEDETKIYTSSTATDQKYTMQAGDVFEATPALNPTWTAKGLASAIDTASGTHEGGWTAVGLCALNTSGGAKSLLAACPHTGMWLWTAAAGWVLVDTRVGSDPSPLGLYIPIEHVPGSQYVYCFDRRSGIWRSNDRGTTWVQVYAVTTSDNLAGKLAVHPTNTGEIWFTLTTGLYKITGAHTGVVGGTATLTGPITAISTHVGPVGISDTGVLYVATKDQGSGSGLRMSTNDGVSWIDGDPTGTLAFINNRPENISFIPSHSGLKPKVLVSGSNVVDMGDLETSGGTPGTSQAFTERQQSQNFAGASGVLSMWNNQAVPPSGGAATLVGSALYAEIELSDCASGTTVTPTDSGWTLDSDAKSGTANGNVRTQIWSYLNNPGGLYGDASHLAVFTCSNTGATVKGKLYEETTPAGTIQALDQVGQAGAVTAVASPAALSVSAAGANNFTGGLYRGMIGAIGSAAFSSQTWSPTSPSTGDGNANNATNVFDALRGTTASGTSAAATSMTYSGGPMTSWVGAIATYYAVAGTPLGFTTTTLPSGAKNSAYSQNVVATGTGIGTLTYSLDASSVPLPAGMAYSSAGVLNGTPTVSGSFNLVFKVTDSTGATAIQAITLVILEPLAYNGGALTTATVNVPISPRDLSTGRTGGVAPFSYASTDAPAGLSVSSPGQLTGTPTTSSAYTFHVTVTDSNSNTATATFTLVVQPAVTGPFPPPGGSKNPIAATLRDENMNVLAPIPFSTLDAQLFYNFVGSWSMTIPYDDAFWQFVKKVISIDPISGDITRNGDCVVCIDWQGLFEFGGKVEKVGYSFATPLSPGTGGSPGPIIAPGPQITLSGGDYLALIANRIAFPDPTKAWSGQTVTSHKLYTGVLETVIKNLVNDNVVNPGSAARDFTLMDIVSTAGLGGNVTYDVKFSQGVDLALMDIIRSLIATGGPMGVSLKRNGQRLSFDCYVPRDLTQLAYFSTDIGNLTAVDLALADPTVTVALLQAGSAPLFSFVSQVPDPTTMWGRIEQYVEQTSETNPSMATQAGQDALNQGLASPSLAVTATDIPLLTFGKDYGLGDRVTVGIRTGDSYSDIVSSVTLHVDPNQNPAISVIPTIGYASDPGGIDPAFSKQLLRRVRRLERRLNRQIG